METRPYNPEAEQPEALPPEYASAYRAVETLQDDGHEAFIVGGAVRDLLMGKTPKDFDITTSANPDQINALFEKSVFNDTSQAHAVNRVVLDGVEMEIASFRKDVDAHLGRHETGVDLNATLDEDLERRDFTINNMALDPVNQQLIYYGESLDDLDNKIVRFVGVAADRIHEDPLRILRAVRFKAKFGFEYAHETEIALKEAVASGEIHTISGERLRDELTNILRSSKSRKEALEDLDQLGILDQLLPELTAGKGVEQGPEFHAEGDVWQHQLLIMEALPPNASTTLLWAALFHDIGKPLKQKIPEGEGRITFHGHDMTSAELARPILNKLKFSNKDKETILWLIEHHINISQLPKMRPANQKKIMNNQAFPDLIELHRADGDASWRTLPDGSISREKPEFQNIVSLWETHKALPLDKREPRLKRDFGIDGKWFIDQMPNFKEKKDGPRLGQMLSQLEEMYANGDLVDQESIEAKARELIAE